VVIVTWCVCLRTCVPRRVWSGVSIISTSSVHTKATYSMLWTQGFICSENHLWNKVMMAFSWQGNISQVTATWLCCVPSSYVGTNVCAPLCQFVQVIGLVQSTPTHQRKCSPTRGKKLMQWMAQWVLVRLSWTSIVLVHVVAYVVQHSLRTWWYGLVVLCVTTGMYFECDCKVLICKVQTFFSSLQKLECKIWLCN